MMYQTSSFSSNSPSNSCYQHLLYSEECHISLCKYRMHFEHTQPLYSLFSKLLSLLPSPFASASVLYINDPTHLRKV